jgi:uncharacterized ParB-like nuclease family protein
MTKQKLLTFIGTFLFVLLPLTSFAQAEILPGFNPNKLIEDSVFSDTKTFGGPEGIQKFLESKNSVLANTSPEFIAKLREPATLALKQTLEDPQPNKERLRTAAELIWDASQSAGLNPQVILVTLNKEQSLITGRQTATPEQLQRALDFAMGFGCPDNQPCGEIYRGFYFQLFGGVDSENNRYLGAAKSLMRSFTTPGGRGPAVNGIPAKVGDTITLDNTLGGYNGVQPQQTVTLSNAATAALYRYTPHVFNGNYNFWRFHNEWFRYPNGTLLRGSDGTVYIIQNGSRLPVPPFVAGARGLNLANAIAASPTEVESYPLDKPLGPVDNTIVSVDGKLYVFINNVKHPASAFVITQRKLNPANAVAVSAADMAPYQDGPQLTPSDGTVLRGQTNHAVYLVEKGTLKLYSAYTFAQHKASTRMQIVPDQEIASYPKQGFVMPLNGSLIKATSDPTVYLIQGGVKRGMTAELFRNYGFKFSDIAVLSDDEVNSLSLGGFATPKDTTYFKAGNDLYLFKVGEKHKISAFVAGQRRITPDFTFSVGEAASWADGAPIPPRDNTAVKSDADQTVYFVVGGVLRPMTYQAFLNRKLTPRSVVVLPQAEVASYAKGEILAK